MVPVLSLHYNNQNTSEVWGLNVNPELGCSGCHFSKERVLKKQGWETLPKEVCALG